MTPADVARRLGMIYTPRQEAYRALRREGHSVGEARARVLSRARSIAGGQAAAVHQFIQREATWVISEAAWPSRTTSRPTS